jgi:hypothetical protein
MNEIHMKTATQKNVQKIRPSLPVQCIKIHEGTYLPCPNTITFAPHNQYQWPTKTTS